MTSAARRIGGAVLLAWFFLGGSHARAQSCPRLPGGLRCAPLPEDAAGRRALLQVLDGQGRADVARGDYPAAARSFGCLVQGDPTPESAGNLAVVLREQGALGDALLVARCAETLAVSGPALERARTRREDIERRLGLQVVAAASSPSPSSAGVTGAEVSSSPSSPSPAPATRIARGWSYASFALGAAALIGAGVTYAFARDRARQFDDEQTRSGYTDRARRLQDEGRELQVTSWIGAGIGLGAAATGAVLLQF